MVPHLKDGDHEVPNNNRPISLLPVLFKVAERISLGQFNNYLTYKSRLTCHQSGNQMHQSTETLSLLVSDHIFSAMDKKQITVMVLIDLSKAFERLQRETSRNFSVTLLMGEMSHVFSFTFFTAVHFHLAFDWWPLAFFILLPPLQNFHVVLPTKKCLFFFSLALDLCHPFSG